MWIEPCCADRQLPSAIKNAKGGFCFFQTNGDVLLETLLKSVSYLAGSGHTLLLSVPEADIRLLRTLNQYMTRGWTKAVLLLSQSPQEDLVSSELAANIDKVQYASDPMILDGLLAIIPARPSPTPTQTGAENKAVVIQGAILSKQDFSLCHYAAWYGRDREILQQAIDPLIAKLKTKARIDHKENPDVAIILNRKFL